MPSYNFEDIIKFKIPKTPFEIAKCVGIVGAVTGVIYWSVSYFSKE